MCRWINIDGKFYKEEEARVSINDRGFLYGDGAFETLRLYHGVLFRAEDHMHRLFDSLSALRIRPRWSSEYLLSEVHKTLHKNNLSDAYVRITVSRGALKRGFVPTEGEEATFVITSRGFVPYPEQLYMGGARAKVVSLRRNPSSPLSRIKSLSFLDNILARLEVEEAGFDEGIMLNTQGDVAGGIVSNLFLVTRDGSIVTPDLSSGIVPGITRGVVISIAKKDGICVVERRVSLLELFQSKEVFLTNTLMELLPVVEVDSKRIGDGTPGSVFCLLWERYKKAVVGALTNT